MVRFLSCLICGAFAMCPSLVARELTNQKGVTIEAKLLGFSNGQVRLQRGSKTFTVPIAEFVEADQLHIRNWAKEQLKNAVSEHGIKSAPGLNAYTHAADGNESAFHIYIPKNYDGAKKLPLIVSAHGADQKGDKEIKGWMKLADEHSCIVVAATNLSGARRVSFDEHCIPDLKKLESILERVKGSLAIDESKVMHTGFSAGGYLTFFSMKLGDEFSHLCFRCCNYSDHLKPYIGAESKQWKGKPVYGFYGSKDARSVLAQVDNAKTFLDATGCNLKWEKIQGWGHRDDKRRAIEWLVNTPGK